MQPRRSVLLVEDVVADQRLITSAFERVGSSAVIEVASTVAEAIEVMRGDDLPVLVMVDLRLEGESGLDLLEWAQSDSRAAVVPFVVLSGSEDRTDVRTSYEAGANAYLVKPSSLEEIDDLARRIDSFWLGACALADDPR